MNATPSSPPPPTSPPLRDPRPTRRPRRRRRSERGGAEEDLDAAAELARERRLLERAVARGERRMGWDDAISYRPVQVALGALAALAVYFGGAKLDAIETSIDGLRKDAVTKVEFVQFQADQRASTTAAQAQAGALERRVGEIEARAAEDRRRAEQQRAEWDRIVAEAKERARAWEEREAREQAARDAARPRGGPR
jgi:hypothetical protein